jgi:four helix bundle protein
MNEGILLSKAFLVAKDIMVTCLAIQNSNHEYNVTNQLIRSANSVAANIQEANAPESRRDFIHKLAISRKELRESIGWLTMLKEVGFIDEVQYRDFNTKLTEVFKLLNSSIGTSRKRLRCCSRGY